MTARSVAQGRYDLRASQIGDTRLFWVEGESGWEQIAAELLAEGTHAKVWAFANTISGAEAVALIAAFDGIYDYETNVFGYEFGGGPGGDGGIDGDPKIEILAYDILAPNVAGYFWAKDWYDQATLDRTNTQKVMTNNAEIFYIDSELTHTRSKLIYSTLAHEFQHMINFNEKTIKKGKTAASWFNELLSMLAEDMIAPKIGIVAGENEGHPIDERIPVFLENYYKTGVSEWLTEHPVLLSYSNVYAFGAYLARNFGGADFLKTIMENGDVDEAAITAALARHGYPLDFDAALRGYAEALVYKDNTHYSFNKTVDSVINDERYTFKKFDIFKTRASGKSGPVKFLYNEGTEPLPVRGIVLETAPDWTNLSGDISFRLSAPRSAENRANPDVQMVILIH
jgi:hypothetical protein